MEPQDSVKLDENGNITLYNADGSKTVINVNDIDVASAKLPGLNIGQLNALQQIAEKEAGKIGNVFKTMLAGFVSQKNAVPGNISKTGRDVIIGDKTESKIFITNNKTVLPKRLTTRMPQIPEDKIVGRQADLVDLRERLFSRKQVVLVNGLGGIGKTTLAQAYVGKHYDDYRHIAWISQVDNIVNDFVNAGGLLISLGIDGKGKDRNAIFNEIIIKLNNIDDKPNLLVVDNVDFTLTQYYDALPTQPNWHILATSREQINKFDLKQLDFLTEAEAVDLFLRHYTRGNILREDIIDLVKSVDMHTLTIEILAKTAQKQRSEIGKLKKAIDDDLKANVYVDHNAGQIEKVTSYLNSIFKLSNLNKNEIWLMKQITCLPPEFHGYDILKELIAPAKSQKDDVFSETMEELTSKGWLLSNREADSHKLHRVIANIVTRQQPIELEDVAPLINRITDKLSIDQTKDNPVDKFPWIPFGNALLAHFSENGAAQIANLQNNLATVLRDLGDYDGAKTLFEKAKNSDEKNFGVDHPNTAVRYSNLALALKDLGDYDEAKAFLEKAKNSDEKNFGVDHPTTAVRYSNLALVLQALGDYEGAKELLEKTKNSAEKNFGEDHPTTAVRYSNLATVLKALGDYEGAKELLEKAKNSAEKNFGVDNPTTAVHYSNLATVLRGLGDYEGAKELLEKAKNSDEKNFGEDHPTTAIRYSNLATVLYDLGDYEEALKLAGKALAVFRKALPEGHPDIAKVEGVYKSIKKKIDETSRK